MAKLDDIEADLVIAVGPDRATVENWFTYHPATDETGPKHYIRKACLNLASEFLVKLPGGPDRTIALRKLQEAMWAANAAIACAS